MNMKIRARINLYYHLHLGYFTKKDAPYPKGVKIEYIFDEMIEGVKICV